MLIPVTVIEAPGAAGGAELVWSETSDTVVVSSTSAASPTTIFAGDSISYDGVSEYEFEFGCAEVQAVTDFIIALYKDGTFLKALAGGNARGSQYMKYRITPSAGAAMYSIGGYCSANSYTCYGTTDGFVPLIFRIYKVL